MISLLKRRAGRPSGPHEPAETRERLLDAAADVFGERGFHRAAVDEIVRRSSASKGTFYFHFPHKQGIFTALVGHLVDRLIARVEAKMAVTTDPVARVDLALRIVFDAFAERRLLARLLLVEAVGVEERLVGIHGRFIALIARNLEDAVASGDIPPQDTGVAACVWMGAINEVIVRWVYAPTPHPLGDVLPSLRTLLLRSVGAASSDQAE